MQNYFSCACYEDFIRQFVCSSEKNTFVFTCCFEEIPGTISKILLLKRTPISGIALITLFY